MRLCRCLLVVALIGLGGARPAFGFEHIDVNDPPQGRFWDEWMEIHMWGQKAGYGHSTMGRDGDLIMSRTTMMLEIVRAEQKIKIGMTQESTETLAGKPVAFASEMDMSQAKMGMRGRIENGKVTLTASQFGVERTSTYDYPQGALMLWGMFREAVRHGFEPGTEYTLQVYSPDLRLDGSVEAQVKVGPWESFDLEGKKQGEGQRVTTMMVAPQGSFETVAWMDKEGRTLKGVVAMPGIGDLVMLATDQAGALADFVPPELFMQTTISVQPLDRAGTQRIEYLVKAKDPKVELGDLPTTGMQTPGKPQNGAVPLVVERMERKPLPPEARRKPPAELAEYLEGNLMINVEDPELVKLAAEAAGDVTEPFALADKLRRFVSDYIADKNLDIGFATASEICRNRQGDCSEHGVLLAALGRIRGLPSRVVVGLAYVPLFGGAENIFGYHMWTQFWIDGKWYDVDAALQETDCSPARIAFAVSSLKDSGLADLSLPLISKIGALDIEIKKVEPRRKGP